MRVGSSEGKTENSAAFGILLILHRATTVRDTIKLFGFVYLSVYANLPEMKERKKGGKIWC
ncbi:uncharacterized protein DS421_12g361320 [Arachis hypogaea]|nr:uncharacterized protein DS421_12g361320 [Arachis hypogaea]